LIDRQLPTPAAHADVVELARMTYRATLGKKTPRRTTVRGALNHKNPWIRRLAIECAVATGDARYLEDLQRSSVFFSEVRYRAALDAAYDVLKKDR
jgi:hypothetical protein